MNKKWIIALCLFLGLFVSPVTAEDKASSQAPECTEEGCPIPLLPPENGEENEENEEDVCCCCGEKECCCES